MYRLLQYLSHALWIALWLAVSMLLNIWTTFGAVAFMGLGIVVYLWALRRGLFQIHAPQEKEQETPVNTEREAKYLVTQVLRSLTHVQVSYLCQEFKSQREARNWLKQALPKPYRRNLGELFENLERARGGTISPGIELAKRIIDRRQELLDMIDAIEKVHRDHPDYVISNPIIFIITENLTAEGSDDPLVVIAAGWNPEKPTLLPHVDALTFFSEDDGQRQIRGQAEFGGVLEALSDDLTLAQRDPPVYLARAVEEDPVKRGVKLSKVPLGFVIGTAELL